MTYTPNSAVYALNSYTWKLLEANLGWKRYQGNIPIIPAAQQPELMQSKTSFIVYGSALHRPNHLYEFASEAISYVVYAGSVTETNKVAGLLYNTFKRQDVAADDVNAWLETEAAGRPNGHRGVYFGSVNVTMVEKAEPAETEGGLVSALVMLEVKYTVAPENTVTTGFAV